MTTSRIARSISRRSAVAGIGAGGIALALASQMASAQEGSLADHPMAGTWLVLANPVLPETPQTPNVSVFATDGTFYAMLPLTDIGPAGTVFQTPMAGIWEPYDEHRAHFVSFQVQSDADGNVTGMVTVDGYPLASEDGQSFHDDGEMVQVTIRDANGAVLDSFPGVGGRPVRGNKLTFDSAVFPEPLTDAATPPA